MHFVMGRAVTVTHFRLMMPGDAEMLGDADARLLPWGV